MNYLEYTSEINALMQFGIAKYIITNIILPIILFICIIIITIEIIKIAKNIQIIKEENIIKTEKQDAIIKLLVEIRNKKDYDHKSE